MISLFLILTTLLAAPHAADHAFYIGVIEIHHVPKTPSATLTIKVFSNDLLTALQNRFGDVVEPAQEALCDKESDRIDTYFSEHLRVKVNDQNLVLTSTSCSSEADAHWLEYAVTCAADWKSLQIEADFFMEIYPTQTEMVHIKENGKSYTVRLTKSKHQKAIVFHH